MSKNKTTDLKKCYCSGVKPEIAYEYIIHINDIEHTISDQIIVGNHLHKLAGTNSDSHFIRMVTKKGKIQIGPLIEVDLTECGIERFIILPFQQETIDLEDCFCKGVKPVITYKYLIKINGKKHSVTQEKISREEILKIVDKDPIKHRLRMFTKNGREILKPGQIVDLTECGVERFVYEALDCIEGFINETPSILPQEDLNFLNSMSNTIDYIKENRLNWIVFRDFDIPEGYNVKKANAAVLIPPHYPTSPLDMIYFYPALMRVDGKMIRQLSNQTIENKTYQRWSRHRTATNRWNPEVDDIESHIDLMNSCLLAEFNKR